MNDVETVQIGARLRERRLERNLSLEDVAVRTRIRKAYLLALEEERFADLPGKVYVIGFLQNYARILDMKADPLVEALDARVFEAGHSDTHVPLPQTARRSIGAILRILLFSAVLLGVIVVAVLWLGGEHGNWFSQVAHTPSRSAPAPVDTATEKTEAEKAHINSEATVSALMSTDGGASADPPVDDVAGNTSTGQVPFLPAGGGVVKLIVDGHGQFTIALDGAEPRDYTAKPGLALSWEVEQIADLALDVDGEVRLLVDGQEYTLSGDRQLRLKTVENGEKNQP